MSLSSQGFKLTFEGATQGGEESWWAEEQANWFHLMEIVLAVFEQIGNNIFMLESRISSRLAAS